MWLEDVIASSSSVEDEEADWEANLYIYQAEI